MPWPLHPQVCMWTRRASTTHSSPTVVSSSALSTAITPTTPASAVAPAPSPANCPHTAPNCSSRAEPSQYRSVRDFLHHIILTRRSPAAAGLNRTYRPQLRCCHTTRKIRVYAHLLLSFERISSLVIVVFGIRARKDVHIDSFCLSCDSASETL